MQTIYADRRLRIVAAAKRAGLNPHQIGRKLKWSLSFIQAVFEEADDTLELPDVVQLAELLRVDARWLAIGASSLVAVATVQALEEIHQKRLAGFQKLSAAELQELVRWATMLPQPIPDFGGVCRYCGCMDDRACADGCSWVDEAATICSACLEPLQPEDGA